MLVEKFSIHFSVLEVFSMFGVDYFKVEIKIFVFRFNVSEEDSIEAYFSYGQADFFTGHSLLRLHSKLETVFLFRSFHLNWHLQNYRNLRSLYQPF